MRTHLKNDRIIGINRTNNGYSSWCFDSFDYLCLIKVIVFVGILNRPLQFNKALLLFYRTISFTTYIITIVIISCVYANNIILYVR